MKSTLVLSLLTENLSKRHHPELNFIIDYKGNKKDEPSRLRPKNGLFSHKNTLKVSFG